MIKLTDAENTSFPLFIRASNITAVVTCAKSKDLPFQHTLVYLTNDPAPFAVTDSSDQVIAAMNSAL